MNKLEHFQKYKHGYEAFILISYFLINGTLLATSEIMEAQRENAIMPFAFWEPFVWEYSSAIGTLVLIPFIFMLLQKVPFNWQAIKYSLWQYFIAASVFSLLHVAMMVGLRKLAYFTVERSYDFGLLWFELLYEFRKDLWSFIFFIIFLQGYKFILSRLQGEANPVAQSEAESERCEENNNIDRLLVKKLGKEFIIKITDVEWLESSGNYVNLHIDGRIYPTRATLTELSEQIESKGFCRIHRSHAINLNYVESITPLSSGDSEVKLINGKSLSLSRRYKDRFKARFV